MRRALTTEDVKWIVDKIVSYFRTNNLLTTAIQTVDGVTVTEINQENLNFDTLVVCTATGSYSVNLPNPVDIPGKILYLKGGSGVGVNVVTIKGYDGNNAVVDGTATALSLTNTTSAIRLVSDGIGYYRIL